MNTFNIRDFGAKEGGELATQAVQAAIDACAANGGGCVLFPAGTFVLSTVYLKSNVKIHFDTGCLVLGSERFDDYDEDEKVDYPLYQDASHSFFHCSMFVAEYCDNIAFTGAGKIDMRSVWDWENKRKIVHRGAKCIALKYCKNVLIEDIDVQNATDLAIYFAGCENVDIFRVKMRVHIDGISPDNCKNVRIEDCDVETGDDGIVFKSSYTLNKLGICENITVRNCKIKSRCNAFKFGTETNGGFKNILGENLEIRETRIAGIAIESVDGAVFDGITVRNVKMKNVYGPIYVCVGDRMRGPKGREVGYIRNVTLENITAEGPYEGYEAIEWNYGGYMDKAKYQYPWNVGPNGAEMTENDVWQTPSNICGTAEHPLENITLKNVRLQVSGGAKTVHTDVPPKMSSYPEVYALGRELPAKGIYFRHIDGLTLENVTVETLRPDVREDFWFENVKNLKK